MIEVEKSNLLNQSFLESMIAFKLALSLFELNLPLLSRIIVLFLSQHCLWRGNQLSVRLNTTCCELLNKIHNEW